jgi:carboxypeptidase PM20D1
VGYFPDHPAGAAHFSDGIYPHTRNYPLTHATLQREYVSDYGLLYMWKGSQPELQPVLLCAHLDVVPADPQNLDQWDHPPFSGTVEGEYVHGRGALDDKVQAITILEAIELLLRSDFQPQRTVYLAFGEDEEAGGYSGAAKIAAWLQERGEQLEAILDEGGAVIHGILPGLDGPAAMVGVTEKGYMTLRLTVQKSNGHSSAPPASTAIGILARAVQRLETHPLPARLKFIRETYKAVGASASPWVQIFFANTWLFGGLLRRRMQSSPQTNASIRTTTAVTMFHSGYKDNILPEKAEAAINFRLAPGDSIASVCDHARKVIADERVDLEVPEGSAWEASPVSNTDGAAYLSLKRAIRQVYPEAAVAPMLVLSATDSHHYIGVCNQIFRFTPFELNQEELERVHNVNERIAVKTLSRMVQFYFLLLKDWAA